MTVVIGIVHDDGSISLGADSADVSGYDITPRKDEKVFSKAPFVMGFTSSFRMGQLLQNSLTVPVQREDQDVWQFMTTTFVDAVRLCLKNGGYAKVKDGEESGGTFLVGYRGRLFFIDNDFQVGESLDKYAAVGCGDTIALGALCATRNLCIDPAVRMSSALYAAERYSAGVRSPFNFVYQVPYKEPKCQATK